LVLLFSSLPASTFAFKGIDEEQLKIYREGIRDFDIKDNSCVSSSGSASVSGSGYNRLKSAVKTYGELAMEMQREYGTPWEVVLAQMQKESGVGTTGVAISGSDNNWLGIQGEGDAGSSSGFAKFSSVEAGIRAWAGTQVLRNGLYDAAFQFLDPNNYDLESFLTTMINVYAPVSAGNDTVAYVQDVLSFIAGPIAEARAEMSWPSSAELAKQENIPIGGRNPLGTKAAGQTSASCPSGDDINAAAIGLSYDHRSEYKGNPIATYDAAMEEVKTRVACTGPKMGDSCDVFVATVYRKTVDPDFPCCGTESMRVNLRENSKYQLVVDGYHAKASSADLLPGDIMILNGHIMMYVELEDGSAKIASASFCKRTSDHAGNLYFSDKRGNYDVIRWKGGS
jgi:hypothetical protein